MGDDVAVLKEEEEDGGPDIGRERQHPPGIPPSSAARDRRRPRRLPGRVKRGKFQGERKFSRVLQTTDMRPSGGSKRQCLGIPPDRALPQKSVAAGPPLSAPIRSSGSIVRTVKVLSAARAVPTVPPIGMAACTRQRCSSLRMTLIATDSANVDMNIGTAGGGKAWDRAAGSAEYRHRARIARAHADATVYPFSEAAFYASFWGAGHRCAPLITHPARKRGKRRSALPELMAASASAPSPSCSSKSRFWAQLK